MAVWGPDSSILGDSGVDQPEKAAFMEAEEVGEGPRRSGEEMYGDDMGFQEV